MIYRPGDFLPMECTRAREPFSDARYHFEPKLDGVRVLAYADPEGRVRLQSRSGREATARYPEAALAIARALGGVGPVVLDGELAILDPEGRPDFAAILRRESGLGAGGDPALVYHAFDVLAVDDDRLTREPLEVRRDELEDLLAPGDPCVRVVGFLPADGVATFRAATEAGLEGVVAKRAGSRYFPGERTRDWLKVKRRDEADLVVGAWVPGQGALTGNLGALVVGGYDDAGALRLVGKVGAGFSRDERVALKDALVGLSAEASPFADEVPGRARFVRPALVVEVEYLEVTEGLRLRAPVFRGLKPDKPPRACRLATELASAPVRGPGRG